MSENILWSVIDRRKFIELTRSLKADEQSRDLVNQIGRALAEALKLTENQEHALSRLMQSIEYAGRWESDLQRNNIFKAANLLGIKLPSSMFASSKVAGAAWSEEVVQLRKNSTTLLIQRSNVSDEIERLEKQINSRFRRNPRSDLTPLLNQKKDLMEKLRHLVALEREASQLLWDAIVNPKTARQKTSASRSLKKERGM